MFLFYRRNFPRDFTADKAIPKGAAAFKHHGNILAMKYRGAKDKAQGQPKIVHLISTKHKANMMNTTRVNAEGNIVQKPEAIMYYNKNMGGVDGIDQQLHSVQILRKTYKWYHKVFFRMLMMALLSAHKLYKNRERNIKFLQFIHDVLTSLVSEAPHLMQNPGRPNDNLVRLTGRHFACQVRYQGQAAKRSFCPKWCRVCTARGIKTEKGHPIRSTWQCPDCPGNPGLCPGECFKAYHTLIDYSKV